MCRVTPLNSIFCVYLSSNAIVRASESASVRASVRASLQVCEHVSVHAYEVHVFLRA